MSDVSDAAGSPATPASILREVIRRPSQGDPPRCTNGTWALRASRIASRTARPRSAGERFGPWRFVTPAFEADYRIVLFDYVRSGKSDLGAYDAQRYSTLGGYARDVLDIVRALDLHDVIFVGHSVSSMVGVLVYDSSIIA